jgi:putative membrane protein (TIGR04086 family)
MNRLLEREECHVFLEIICGIIRYIATYVKAQVIIMSIIGVFTASALGVSGIRNGILWGLLAGVLYFTILLCVSLVLEQGAAGISGNLITVFFICAGSGMLGGMIG